MPTGGYLLSISQHAKKPRDVGEPGRPVERTLKSSVPGLISSVALLLIMDCVKWRQAVGDYRRKWTRECDMIKGLAPGTMGELTSSTFKKYLFMFRFYPKTKWEEGSRQGHRLNNTGLQMIVVEPG